MDPNANLWEQRKLALEISQLTHTDPRVLAKADRLATLALALDTWISKGGFLPDRWEAARKAESR